MTPIGAYIRVKSREGAHVPEARYPVSDPIGGGEQRPGLGERVRKAIRSRRRVDSEPGFAGSQSLLSEFVPQLRAYPYSAALR